MTIAAISTPTGIGGIAVIRLSGDEAKSIAERFVKPLTDHRVVYSPFVVDGETLDEVMATYLQAPHSYTGDDTVEIACHGSLYIQQAILQQLLQTGARMAEPGEFTRRAFINGRLNLSQAEAVADLINSTSEASNKLAISQLRGGYQQKLKTMRQELLDLTALLELELDFSQEDVEFADRSRLLTLTETIESEASRLVESFRTGNAVKNGIRVAIVGEPNVGKSSLLNALLDDDRAIVSNIPGTTRDTIEDTLTIDGHLIRFIDTAGIRQSDNPIEQAGIDRSLKAAKEADVVIYVQDATDCQSTPNIPDTQATVIAALNKCDLIEAGSGQQAAGSHSSIQAFNISAKTGMGLEELKQAIVAPFKEVGDSAMLTNLRHYEAMKRLLDAIRLVKQGLQSETPSDLVAIDLRDAIHQIGTITGEVTTDEILGTIFSRFCVGK
ncbi:MAG: tRNA uridine-5-carboxymethylaminomethyl(34) synthesis GTPase MnmE [Bacteroidales bacterium]|nr:tRNA uridine-5-carboxymethylaminomethyl(34) synthesis GTPase MnmE [Bacteroidales bacterium]